MVKTYLDANGLYEVMHRDMHAERDGFRISELTLSTTQQVPWHYHSEISDTFYVLEGQVTVYVREPKQTHKLETGESLVVGARRPHLVRNTGKGPATFLVLQGVGQYDYVPIPEK